MRCSLRDCAGQMESRLVVHTVRHRGEVVVIDHVPAEVCNVCGDVLFTPETVEELECILRERHAPMRLAPLYEFARPA